MVPSATIPKNRNAKFLVEKASFSRLRTCREVYQSNCTVFLYTHINSILTSNVPFERVLKMDYEPI